MAAIVVIASIAALWYLKNRSQTEAFLYVYMTALLVLPTWCRWIIPGLPDPMFHEAAILPIFVAYLLNGIGNWKISFLDFLIAALLLFMGVSEYINAGYPDAQNKMFDLLCSGLFPYMLAKALINSNRLRVQFARQFVWLLALVFFTGLFEFMLRVNPYRLILDHFFPGQGWGWVTTFRYGMPRVSGPFGHPILNGIITLIGVQFALWLKNSNGWEARFQKGLTGMNKARTLTAMLLGTLFITFERGPQIGTAAGWLMSWIGRGQKPRVRARILLLVGLGVGIPLVFWFSDYVSVGRAGARSEMQETAAYRKELIDKYEVIALKRSILGWGTSGWPKVPDMPSIDNYYLLLCLMHGFIATGLFVLILLVLMVRLYRNGMRSAPLYPPGSSLSFTLFGLYAGFAFTLATVFMGESVIPVFFMVTGFAEGYLIAGGDKTNNVDQQIQPVSITNIPQFRRIVA